ncbi:hypothetical protein P7L78_09230 [Tistrella bauzanensis]|uniref:hypothetical protein n=1 Tax=Tistrella TaxID=171436 RepID=UPI0031F5FA39
MRRVSLNVRASQEALTDDQVQVVLIEIRHPLLTGDPVFGDAIRLSTDNADEIQRDPHVRGTRSSWRGANPITQPFIWVMASALVPSDIDDQPAQARLVLETIDPAMIDICRSFRTPATVTMGVGFASTPDAMEQEWTQLQLTTADASAGEIVLSMSREHIELERYPSGRMSRSRFPGLYL